MHSLYRLILITFVLILLAFLLLVSINPLRLQQTSSVKKYLGINLLENYSVNYYLPYIDNILENVHYFFRYEKGYNLNETLLKIIQMGGNTVVFCPGMWMKSRNSTEVLYDARYKQKLVEAMSAAKSKHLKVILRPMLHIMALEKNLDWRGTIEPQDSKSNIDWENWFKSYEAATRFFLDAALQSEADVYVAGVELLSSTDTGEIKYWSVMMDHLHQVKNAAHSQINFAYDALYVSEIERIHDNVVKGNKEYINFLSKIDHLGINFYPKLIDEIEYPQYDAVVTKNMREHGEKINGFMKDINSRISNDVNPAKYLSAVIAEFGIRSAKYASIMPWVHPTDSDILDYDEQAKALTIGIQELNKFPFINGILIWNTYVDPYYGIKDFTGRENKKNGENTFTIRGKPAEEAIQKEFYSILNLSWVPRLSKLSYIAYILSAIIIFLFGLHRISLIKNAFKKKEIKKKEFFTPPFVTIQIPIFNEKQVIPILLQCMLEMDYPHQLMEIQILDDSTDDTPQAVKETIDAAQSDIQIHHIRRKTRSGYKAGALAEGLKTAKGEFVAIFDADFKPRPDFLKVLLPYFSDANIGMVQAKWGFTNASKALLTRTQSLFLGGHFNLDHTARFNNGCFFNFNGTAGIFRKTCIDQAGGWEADSLTEDLDLSYRAQMKDWKFVPVMDYEVPSELPEKILLYKRQQQRWVKGSMQVLKKLFFKITFAKLPFKIKKEAFFHLSGNSLYAFVLILAICLLPTINARLTAQLQYGWIVDLPVLFGGTLVMFVFYLASAKKEGSSTLIALIDTVVAMLISIGMSVNNTIALLEGLIGMKSPFERTLKKGDDRQYSESKQPIGAKALNLGSDIMINLLEWMVCYQCLETILKAIELNMLLSLPFSVLFFSGFLYVASQTTIELALKVFRL